jgi:peptide/nickel transport system substrate-binding protein
MTEHDNSTEDRLHETLSRPLSRRQALQALATAGVAAAPAGAALSALTASAAAATQAGVKPQQAAIVAAFDPMDPAVSSNGATINLMFYVYETLYRAEIGDPTTFVPELAVGRPKQIDNTTYRVTLRHGAKFSNGDPLTAEDVVFSFQRVKRFGDASFLGKYLVNFKSMRAVGTNVVEMKLVAPMALLEQRLAVIRVLSRKAVRGPNSGNVTKFQPVGSGPFEVVSAVPSSGAVLKKRKSGYNGPLTHDFPANEVDFHVVGDPTALLTGLQSGRFDAVADLPKEGIQTVQHDPNLKVATPPGHGMRGLLFNGSKAPWNDPRVRQAIMYGIDKPTIVKVAYAGFADVANAMVPSTNSDFTMPTHAYSKNNDKARALLAAAGFPKGLDMELQIGTNIAGSVETGQVMQQQLKDIGVNVTLKQGDLGALYANVANKSYSVFYVPSSPAILGSADAEFIYRWLYYGGFATQYMWWTDPAQKQVEALLDKALVQPTFAKYKATMAQVINITNDQGPFQTIVLSRTPVAWNPKTCPAITPSQVGNIYLGKHL